jgi:phosphate transport system substrate-binding protein
MQRLPLLAAAALVAFAAGAADTRDQIRAVGSSTVFPYAQAVAEQFARASGARSPVVEANGTGGGMQVFCGGLGPAFPDIVNASRAMQRSEFDLCARNGVDEVTEVPIGFDGLAIAHSIEGPDIDLTRAQIFQALAAEVEVDDRVVPNPYARWNEIDPALPADPIRVFGPPPTSGTRDAFVELVMVKGCAEFPAIQALDAVDRAIACARLRQDGPYIEAGEHDNVIVQRLQADPTALGIFGYSFLYENADRLKAVAVDGVVPNEETIASGAYEISRPLFIYVKNAHRSIIPGLREFIAEFVSEASLGPAGYLEERGLVPLSDDPRQAARHAAETGAPMDRFR